jgi:hypothetical protein
MRPPGTLGFRPTYHLHAQSPPDALLPLLNTRLAGRATFAGPHLLLGVDPAVRRPWSPWLHVDVRAEEELAGSLLTCRLSPHPSIWTGVMLAELALLSTVFFAAFFAVGQHVAESPPWAWWVALGALVLAIGLWLGAQLGQHLAREQMELLMAELESIAGVEQANRQTN